MRILMSLSNHYFPPDIRVLYEARTLIEAGHEVSLLCKNRQGGSSEEIVDGIKVFRVTMPQNYLWHLWSTTCYGVFDPLWRKYLARIVEQEDIEALHIHDLPSVIMGLNVARKFGIPLIADLHENYAAAVPIMHSKSNWSRRLILFIIDPVWLWKLIEKHCVRSADSVITIVDEAREHYVADYGVSPDKFVVLMNTPDLDYFYSFALNTEVLKKYEPYFTITYVGNFGPHRGVQTAISAMPKITGEISNARLLLVGGSGGKQDDILRKLAKDMGVEESIEFAGQQPFSLMPSYLSASKICLVPAIASGPQTDASSPHKLFQAMAMGKPVIVASMRSLTRIILDTGAGLVYTAGDAGALADAVISLYRDSDLTQKMGEAAIYAVRQKYNWEMEGGKLVDLYEQLRN